jgi:hypothetical protein
MVCSRSQKKPTAHTMCIRERKRGSPTEEKIRGGNFVFLSISTWIIESNPISCATSWPPRLGVPKSLPREFKPLAHTQRVCSMNAYIYIQPLALYVGRYTDVGLGQKVLKQNKIPTCSSTPHFTVTAL